jgi:hypothetical protein
MSAQPTDFRDYVIRSSSKLGSMPRSTSSSRATKIATPRSLGQSTVVEPSKLAEGASQPRVLSTPHHIGVERGATYPGLPILLGVGSLAPNPPTKPCECDAANPGKVGIPPGGRRLTCVSYRLRWRRLRD